MRTPGGHRRYPADQIRQLLADTQDPDMADRRMADITSLLGTRPAR